MIPADNGKMVGWEQLSEDIADLRLVTAGRMGVEEDDFKSLEWWAIYLNLKYEPEKPEFMHAVELEKERQFGHTILQFLMAQLYGTVQRGGGPFPVNQLAIAIDKVRLGGGPKAAPKRKGDSGLPQ